jgi:arabinose-5-phosphate isomerase
MSEMASILDRTAQEVMTPDPITIDRAMLAAQALNILEERKITSLVVVGADRVAEGVIHLHDLWRTELI